MSSSYLCPFGNLFHLTASPPPIDQFADSYDDNVRRSLGASSLLHGFSSEALALISCSLNVIMVMITQMTPGLFWGGGSVAHASWFLRYTVTVPPEETTTLHQSWWPFSCPHGPVWKRPHKPQPASPQKKSWIATRKMDIFCCLPITAVFQSNYLSLLRPLLSQYRALRPAGIQTPDMNEVD